MSEFANAIRTLDSNELSDNDLSGIINRPFTSELLSGSIFDGRLESLTYGEMLSALRTASFLMMDTRLIIKAIIWRIGEDPRLFSVNWTSVLINPAVSLYLYKQSVSMDTILNWEITKYFGAGPFDNISLSMQFVNQTYQITEQVVHEIIRRGDIRLFASLLDKKLIALDSTHKDEDEAARANNADF